MHRKLIVNHPITKKRVSASPRAETLIYKKLIKTPQISFLMGSRPVESTNALLSQRQNHANAGQSADGVADLDPLYQFVQSVCL